MLELRPTRGVLKSSMLSSGLGDSWAVVLCKNRTRNRTSDTNTSSSFLLPGFNLRKRSGCRGASFITEAGQESRGVTTVLLTLVGSGRSSATSAAATAVALSLGWGSCASESTARMALFLISSSSSHHITAAPALSHQATTQLCSPTFLCEQ